MDTSQLPFNVQILDITKERLSKLRPVAVQDIFEGGTNNFHEDGLFSTLIFGRVGSDDRDTRFSFIDIKTEVFHPLIYRHLTRLKGLYRGIMSGRSYAIWDDEKKDFAPSDQINGQTGFQFFVDHWRDIDFGDSRSSVRQTRVGVIEKYKDLAMVNRIIVLPAGLRDIEIDDSGRVSEEPINESYRRILRVANTISKSAVGEQTETLNQSRNALQMAFNEIFDILSNLLSGKGGFIQKKWASRRIFNGTRNVITSMDPTTEELGSKSSIKLTDTQVGLYQFLKAIEPVAIHKLSHGFLSGVFGEAGAEAKLVNKKTLKSEYVRVPSEIQDRWTTQEGLAKVIASFSQPGLRHKPVEIADHYLGLIYLGFEGSFRLFSDIDELPEWAEKENVYPITLIQLIYLSGYREWNDYPCLVTRYPVTGLGSIYPSTTYVRTTVVSERRHELGEDWEPLGDDFIAYEFPVSDPPEFFDSLAPHPSRLEGLGADFDGDTCSFNALYTQESIEEIGKALTRKTAFLRPEGGFKTSTSTDIVDLVLHNMTGD